MGTLHTVNKSPFQTNTLQSCLAHAKAGDTVLLIEDGVYGAMSDTATSALIAASDAKICVLGPDFAARGINAARILEGVETVDYDGFVDLAATSDRLQAWL